MVLELYQNCRTLHNVPKNLYSNLRKILMNLRKDTSLLRLVSQSSSPVTLEKHVRCDQMLDLAFAGFFERYSFGL